MTVRDETAETPSEVHGAKNNEVRETMNKSSLVCARARGPRIRRGTFVDATESVRWQCLVSASVL
jgi:hypothetical protein